jgi:hypothetical protein
LGRRNTGISRSRQITELFERINERFRLAAGGEFSIEIDPRELRLSRDPHHSQRPDLRPFRRQGIRCVSAGDGGFQGGLRQ